MADGNSGLNSPNLVWMSASIDVNSTGDKAHFAPPIKCQIMRVGITFLDGQTDAGGGTVKFDKVTGSTRGDGDAGVLTIAAANNDSKHYYEDPATRVTLSPGDQVFVEVTTDSWGAATTAVATIVYQEIPEVPGNVSAMVAG